MILRRDTVMTADIKEKMSRRIKSDDGFIAALDQSGGSTPTTLRLYGVEADQYAGEHEMFAKIHEMRVRIIRSSAFSGKSIIGAILFERTISEEIDGQPVPIHLYQALDIVPFLKVDRGLAETRDDVQLMNDIPNLEESLERAVSAGIFGTKMRSVIHAANLEGIKTVVSQQFELAASIREFGLVSIIEPEIDIYASDKPEAEQILLDELRVYIEALGDSFPIILKLTIPTVPDLYSCLVTSSHVLRIAALSGGYSTKEACRLLKQNRGMIASFSRALTEGLTKNMDDGKFNDVLKGNIDDIYNASIE